MTNDTIEKLGKLLRDIENAENDLIRGIIDIEQFANIYGEPIPEVFSIIIGGNDNKYYQKKAQRFIEAYKSTPEYMELEAWADISRRASMSLQPDDKLLKG